MTESSEADGAGVGEVVCDGKALDKSGRDDELFDDNVVWTGDGDVSIEVDEPTVVICVLFGLLSMSST
jgi:hypothetical protein